jgi:hypothetical protein
MLAIANFSRLIMLRFRLNVRQRATKGITYHFGMFQSFQKFLNPKPKRIDVPISVGSRSEIAMSALPPKADIVQHGGNVRFVPKADMRLIRSPRWRVRIDSISPSLR